MLANDVRESWAGAAAIGWMFPAAVAATAAVAGGMALRGKSTERSVVDKRLAGWRRMR